MFHKIFHWTHDRRTKKRIIADVEKFGWHILLFEQNKNEPSFAYTIGLWKTFNHPEIIAFGMTTPTLHSILNNAGSKVQEGNNIELYQDDNDIFETIPVQFLSVDKSNMKDFFGYGFWFNKYRDFPALQLVWSDRNGSYPWQKDFEKEFQKKQVILNKEYRGKIK